MLRLKFLRLERRLSQRELADLTDIPQAEISRIESGRTNPRDVELLVLAGVLGCDPKALMVELLDETLDLYREDYQVDVVMTPEKVEG